MDRSWKIPAPMQAALEAAYAMPPRAYHHAGHIDEVLASHAEVARAVGWKQPREVQLAILFHDAIYVAGAHDNEAQSAALARESIAKWLPGEKLDVDRVAALIELTARHGSLKPGDVDAEAALFLDCDMAILGAEPARFDEYDASIAKEYAHVPPELFDAGRRAFLQRVLESERIFLSPFFHERLDAKARGNLRRRLGR